MKQWFGAALAAVLADTMKLRWTGLMALLAACGGADAPAWAGSVDTLPSGMVVVHNPAEGLWDSASAWRLRPMTRIGTVEGTGPDLFGRIGAIELDAMGRIWVLDAQAQEIRVFAADGGWIRTIGRKGGGPGEFNQVMGMAWGPNGHLWVVDPQNNRISVLDTAGRFITSHQTQGGFIAFPWPGGFDEDGNFYNIAPYRAGNEFAMALVRYDTAGAALDTLQFPRWQGEENYFEHVSEDGSGRMRTDVPFSPGLVRRFTHSGDFWFAHTGTYELFLRTGDGDTVLMATKPFARVPVTDLDEETAIEGLEWFTRQGGRVDRSRIPSEKPAIRALQVGEDGTVWVQPVLPNDVQEGTVFEVFDPAGHYLGRITSPVPVQAYIYPVIRDGWMLAVTRDDLEVQYVVLARIENYETPPLGDRGVSRTLGGVP